MEPNPNFKNRPPQFYALVRYASQELGYSKRRSKKNPEPRLKRYDREDILGIATSVNLGKDLANDVREYMNYRSEVLEDEVSPKFMDREEARKVFERLRKKYNPTCKLPMNKQKGDKSHHSYFTCIINMISEYNLGGVNFNDNPGQLATITDDDGVLVKTLSRRVDGAYPSLRDPIAIWEIKEYYGTTTFGSRVADAVYETQLDGHELDDAEKSVSHDINHYLFVDDRSTWWEKGRSYLCRLVDAMHEGTVDEVIFGREVLDRWPIIIKGWSVSR